MLEMHLYDWIHDLSADVMKTNLFPWLVASELIAW
jgi:hypothetical protein